MSRTLLLVLAVAAVAFAGESIRYPASARNLLVDARCSGNLEGYKLGLRGAPDHVVYDLQRGRFLRRSQWHEYGVGFGKSLGVVPEDRPAFWMARWPEPVEANTIVLSGVYPNQPQPRTSWKVELREKGEWHTLARGQGGWYDTGRMVWGGRGTEPRRFDAIRVAVFSPDGDTPLESIHFRGEEGLSWVVAHLPPIDARIVPPRGVVRAGEPATFRAQPLAGEITSWEWRFGQARAEGQEARHAFDRTGDHEVELAFSDGQHRASVAATVAVAPPVEARIEPLGEPVMAGEAVELRGFDACGKAKALTWEIGEDKVEGGALRLAFDQPGSYKATLTVSDGRYSDQASIILRAHSPRTVHVPGVFLDTDQKNEVDDQHYFAYGLFSQLDVLGINSVHHGGGQEPVNYREILHVLDLARQSGLPPGRVPFVFRGADQPLEAPHSGRWQDTEPIVTDASEAILAAARGACPQNPLWVLPVGPGTNVACAILQARRQGLDLADRMRVVWLGGSNRAITGEFNGNNDPWSMYVVARSGVPTWIIPAPVGGRIRMDVRKEADLYPDNPLGRYLRKIVPRRSKSLYDPAAPAAVISMRLGLGWVQEAETVTVGGPKDGYRWTEAEGPSPVRVVRQIDVEAMKRDIFDTMKGVPMRLIGVPPAR
ncbi:MAG: nucleoside hydrolase [Candidatus Brocadiia bacterium]